MYNEKKIKKETYGIKINLSLLAFKYEKDPHTLAKVFCSQIKDALDVVFPTNGNGDYNRVVEKERDKYYETLLNEVINQCVMLKSEI